MTAPASPASPAAPSSPALHVDVASFAALLGAWRGAGRGEYPTIASFGYDEEVTFGHVGKPFLAYGQRTWRQPDRFPLHAETGYLRYPGGGPRAELVLAHPSGFAEIEVGTWDGRVLELRTDAPGGSLEGTPTAKPVARLVRRFELDGDVLRYTVAMAAVGIELTHHLAAELTRVT
jgi:THAP4-like, heme-binding beta-barrel domain